MLAAPPLTVRMDLPAPRRVTFDPAASVMPRPFCFTPFCMGAPPALKALPSCLDYFFYFFLSPIV